MDWAPVQGPHEAEEVECFPRECSKWDAVPVSSPSTDERIETRKLYALLDINTTGYKLQEGKVHHPSHSLLYLQHLILCQAYEDLQDGRGVRHGDHLPPHRYTRNTSTCGTAPTEHLLSARRRPQTSEKARNSPGTWVGQTKKQKTETKE